MREHDLQELLAAAQARVRGVRTALARPRTCNVDECITLLREAQGYLEWLRDSLRHAAPAHQLRAQALALLVEIQQAGVLLEQAARYGRRFIERLRPPEYTAAGSPPPLCIRGSLSLLG
jgi:hypothetical protein